MAISRSRFGAARLSGRRTVRGRGVTAPSARSMRPGEDPFAFLNASQSGGARDRSLIDRTESATLHQMRYGGGGPQARITSSGVGRAPTRLFSTDAGTRGAIELGLEEKRLALEEAEGIAERALNERRFQAGLAVDAEERAESMFQSDRKFGLDARESVLNQHQTEASRRRQLEKDEEEEERDELRLRMSLTSLGVQKENLAEFMKTGDYDSISGDLQNKVIEEKQRQMIEDYSRKGFSEYYASGSSYADRDPSLLAPKQSIEDPQYTKRKVAAIDGLRTLIADVRIELEEAKGKHKKIVEDRLRGLEYEESQLYGSLRRPEPTTSPPAAGLTQPATGEQDRDPLDENLDKLLGIPVGLPGS